MNLHSKALSSEPAASTAHQGRLADKVAVITGAASGIGKKARLRHRGGKGGDRGSRSEGGAGNGVRDRSARATRARGPPIWKYPRSSPDQVPRFAQGPRSAGRWRGRIMDLV